MLATILLHEEGESYAALVAWARARGSWVYVVEGGLADALAATLPSDEPDICAENGGVIVLDMACLSVVDDPEL